METGDRLGGRRPTRRRRGHKQERARRTGGRTPTQSSSLEALPHCLQNPLSGPSAAVREGCARTPGPHHLLV
jgi:hypothetical protein